MGSNFCLVGKISFGDFIGNRDSGCSEWGVERCPVKFSVLLLFIVLYSLAGSSGAGQGCSLHVQAAEPLQGGFHPKFSSDAIALPVFGATASIQAVTAPPRDSGETNLGFLWRFLWILLKIWALDAVPWARQLLAGSWVMGNASRPPLWPGLMESWNSHSFLDFSRAWKTHLSSCRGRSQCFTAPRSPRVQ